ncbi:hypothetical protein L1276_001319 [Flavobacterium sp. HSC-32F16]|uniref:DUF3226 domain-containing protein n=1 Tax=Flavobacterium sp. HSC-32F16 TaxID=2910964 RepID=UPI0020A4A3C5|nr:DUF3226 domain-containing protein [Flavobacterium sp. HSC-32F16]MCP2026179.1 hypothetical protein [Flavobacterium sp. HSC-32F16]
MAIQITAVLCEGPHDVAFLVKIIKSEGFKNIDNLKISEFPTPIDLLLKSEVSKSNIEDLNLQEVRQALLPTNALLKDNKYLFFYSLGGDGKKNLRSKIVLDFLSFVPNNEEITVTPLDTSFSILYFFDSDEKGVESRVSELNKEIEEILNEKPFNSHKETKKIKDIKFGSFVFSGDDNNKGKLEDILLPLMVLNNEDIFSNAHHFLSDHFNDDRLFPLKMEIENDVLVEKRADKLKKKLKYDSSKSIIGTVGQLQKSGSSNVVCISQTDYLTLEKIRNNKKCQEIVSYLNDFLSV